MLITDIDAHPPYKTVKSELAGEMTDDRFFSELSRAGIYAACGTLTVSETFNTSSCADTVEKLNEYAAALSEKYSKRYFPAVHVSAGCSDFSCGQLEKYHRFNIFGLDVKEFFSGNDEATAAEKILNHACLLKLTAVLKNDGADIACRIAEKFPGLKIVFGGRTAAPAMPHSVADIMKKHGNLYLNLSGDIFGYNYMLHEGIKSLPEDRVLFGSGFFVNDPAFKVAGTLYELRDCAPEVTQKILSENAANLLGVTI